MLDNLRLRPPDDPTHLCLFGDPQSDRARLVAQAYQASNTMKYIAPKFINPGNIKRILDLGCGDGLTTITLAEMYPNAEEIIGMDMDPIAIQTAMKNLNNASPDIKPERIKFFAGNVQEWIPNGWFDLIYASMLFHHLTQPQKTMMLAYDHLYPSGYLWVKSLIPQWKLGINGDNATWNTLLKYLETAYKKIGRALWIGTEVPFLIRESGFGNIKQDTIIYSINNSSFEGRTSTSISLGMIFNAHKQIAMLNNLEDDAVMLLYKQLSDNIPRLYGKITTENIIAQRLE